MTGPGTQPVGSGQAAAPAAGTGRTVEPGGWLGPVWTRLAGRTAAVAASSGAIGLLAAGSVYRRETVALSDAATAQDVVTLLVVAPLLALLAVQARRGSLPAFLCLLGGLEFAAYNAVIYTFSVHFGPLFLLWVAMLGLSTFTLIGALTGADLPRIARYFARGNLRGTGWFLIVLAAAFALLWLREIVPDLLSGRGSRSAGDWNVPTNPVHVLDLALFLPALVLTGVLLRRAQPLGYATAAAQLVWAALTCLPILVTPLVQQVRGRDPGWSVLIPIGVVLVLTLIVLARLLRHLAARDAPAS